MVWALFVPGLLVFMLLRFYKNIYIKHQRDLQLTPEALKLGIFIGAIITTVGGHFVCGAKIGHGVFGTNSGFRVERRAAHCGGGLNPIFQEFLLVLTKFSFWQGD